VKSGTRAVGVTAVALFVVAVLAVAFASTATGFGGVAFEGDETDTYGENDDTAPPGCEAIEGEKEVNVVAVSEGTGYPLYEYSPKVVETEPCTRLSVTFESSTRIRHQFVVEGLPEEVHPDGYFGIEADGGAEETATFVTPGEDTTLPVESTVGNQADSGLRGQIVLGEGDGDIDGVPGVTKDGWRESGDRLPAAEIVATVFGIVAGLSVAALARRVV